MFQITADMLQPIVDSVTTNVPIVAGVGMSIIAVGVGIRFVIRTINQFM
ncbi:MAG: hypothetical protein FWF59_12770 [Turicibacter sp.]|nr:hypothetical protein [Turicibacter sp.]